MVGRELTAKLFFAITSALVSGGLVLQVVLAATNDSGACEGVPARLVNTFSFFTIQSNIIVAVTTGMLAAGLNRSSTLFQTFRLVGLVAITITGVVFHIAIASLHELTGKEALADFVFHTLSPIVTVLGWLAFGPRRQTTSRVVRLSVIFPVCWLVYTLIRGAFVTDRFGNDYYPYEFLNVQQHGYASVWSGRTCRRALFRCRVRRARPRPTTA